MKTTYLKRLNKIAKRAKAWSKIQPACNILSPKQHAILRHVGTAY